MRETHRQWTLARRPVGRVDEACFALQESEIPRPGPGQALVKTRYLSFEPAMRGWIDDRPNYLPAVEIGAVMRGMAVSEVIESDVEGLHPGDLVIGTTGWQEFAIGDAGLRKLPAGVDPTAALSVLGMTGMTAYFGLLEYGRPQAGETVVVSGAAGATGSVVGQIAKIQGARVVGIAGGAEKCAWLVEKAGFDAAIDYKSEDIGARLEATCPDGIDVFFDNVGGEALEAVLDRIALRARIVICGAITRYSEVELPPGPPNYINLMIRRARMEGFVVLDHLARAGEAHDALEGWIRDGRITWEVDVQQGFENVPATLVRLYTGENFGKQLLAL